MPRKTAAKKLTDPAIAPSGGHAPETGDTKDDDAVRPFLKWAGGKRKLVPHLREHLVPATRLIEPFCGSASVGLALRANVGSLWLNDVNEDVVSLYQIVQGNLSALLEAARPFFKPEQNREEAYYELRARFNQTKEPIERAALFLYLNRHGYNGLCRYNSSGEFNVPFGRYAKAVLPEPALRNAANLLVGAEITCLDFTQVMAKTKRGDRVYCDPPYVPLSDTAKFTSYSKGGFGLEEQEELVDEARKAANRGVVVVISNHDTPEIRKLYRGAKQQFLDVRRSISCDGENRALAREVIAVYGASSD